MYRCSMESVAPHVPHLARPRRVAIALTVAVQALALAWPSPELHQAWMATLAVAAVLASLAVVRVRRAWVALAGNFALTCAVFLSLGMAVGVVRSGHASVAGWSCGDLLVAAGWWWALHAPVVVMRWRTQGMPADVAVGPVFEVLGASMAATAIVLLKTGDAMAGPTWLCLALGLGFLARARKPRPTTPVSSGPPEHARQESGAPYRAARTPTPARARASWARWALFAAMLGWGGALVGPGRAVVRARRAAGQMGAVEREMRALRVGDDPCGSGMRGAARREFTSQNEHSQGSRVGVWASGAIVSMIWGMGGACERFPQGRCLPSETARRLIERWNEAPASAKEEAWRLVSTPPETGPLSCAAGRWCSISAKGEGEQTSGHCGMPQPFCTLRLNGEFQRGMFEGRPEQSGRIPAAAARSLIESVEAIATAYGPPSMPSEGDPNESNVRDVNGYRRPVLVVGVGPDDTRVAVDFPQARAIHDLLWQRLCNALPGEMD
ncbi:MAG: hypothetical protein JWM10_5205 [Myxococcaceae bacterium]|nr:hypothetical protein [Myxococcaceae bacterium]